MQDEFIVNDPASVASLQSETCAVDAGAADDQHIFDLSVRLQYSDNEAVLAQALQVNEHMTLYMRSAPAPWACMLAYSSFCKLY